MENNFNENATVQTEEKASFMDSIKNPKDFTAEFSEVDIDKHKLLAVLSYFGLFYMLIPIFAKHNSPFARFHANQGLVLFLASIIVSIAYSIICFVITFIGGIVMAVNVVLGAIANIFTIIIVCVLGLAICIVFIALPIFGIANVATGKAKELPLIGKFRILK